MAKKINNKGMTVYLKSGIIHNIRKTHISYKYCTQHPIKGGGMGQAVGPDTII
jgi:hypothetical protein